MSAPYHTARGDVLRGIVGQIRGLCVIGAACPEASVALPLFASQGKGALTTKRWPFFYAAQHLVHAEAAHLEDTTVRRKTALWDEPRFPRLRAGCRFGGKRDHRGEIAWKCASVVPTEAELRFRSRRKVAGNPVVPVAKVTLDFLSSTAASRVPPAKALGSSPQAQVPYLACSRQQGLLVIGPVSTATPQQVRGG